MSELYEDLYEDLYDDLYDLFSSKKYFFVRFRNASLCVIMFGVFHSL